MNIDLLPFHISVRASLIRKFVALSVQPESLLSDFFFLNLKYDQSKLHMMNPTTC